MRRNRKGFTLVELLVVIGVIALLISILMPALARAKEQANWLKCMSNMRQIGQAFMMYCNNNKGRFPQPAGGGESKADWIYWEDMPKGARTDRPLDGSAIAPYLGIPVNPEVLRCPSDDVNARTSGNYRYSYSVNYLICRLDPARWDPVTTYGKGESGAPLRITDIVSPSDKILLIDESHTTVDDGCWAWMSQLGLGQNLISNRHMKRNEMKNLRTDPNAGKGNCCFADGHVDYVERKMTYNAFNYDPKKRN